jgi:hypothetical protein
MFYLDFPCVINRGIFLKVLSLPLSEVCLQKTNEETLDRVYRTISKSGQQNQFHGKLKDIFHKVLSTLQSN